MKLIWIRKFVLYYLIVFFKVVYNSMILFISRCSINLKTKKYLKLSLVAISGIVLIIFIYIVLIGEKRVKLIKPSHTVLLLDKTDEFIGELSKGQQGLGYWPLPEKLPKKLCKVILAAEDKRFYSHCGVDFLAVVRAIGLLCKNFKIVSGASTIPMQIARMQHPKPRTFFNKLLESYVAIRLMQSYSREEILRQYMLLVPQGNRIHGFAYGSRIYFKKPLCDLSIPEYSILTAILQAPGKMNLYTKKGKLKAIDRAQLIIERMKKFGWISNENFDSYNEDLKELALHNFEKPHRSNSLLHAIIKIKKLDIKNNYLIRTSLDIELQERIQKIVNRFIEPWRSKQAGNVAVIVAEKMTGKILSYIGSSDYFDDKYSGSIDYTQVPRSSGSLLKPFIYAQGLAEKKYSAASILNDVGMYFNIKGGLYRPANYDKSFRGPILYRYALANSRNIPAIEVTNKLGVENVYKFLRRFKLVGKQNSVARQGLSIAIGGLYITLFDAVNAYGILANDGKNFSLKIVKDEIINNQKSGKPVQIIPSAIARQITLFLSDPMARLPAFPRMGNLEYPFPVAVKTGTSQGFRDAWTIAYSKKYIVGVWVGHPDNLRMKNLGGYNSAAILTKQVMCMLHPEEKNGLHDDYFPSPKNYCSAKICRLSGKLASDNCGSVVSEWFRPEDLPNQKCDYHKRIAFDKRTGDPVSNSCPAKFIEYRTITELPSIFSDWAKSSGFAVASPSGIFIKGKKKRITKTSISIKYPINKTRLHFVPDIPVRFQTIALKAIVDPPVPQVVWYIDNLPFQIADFPYTVRWQLNSGIHTIQAKSPYYNALSDKIQIYVE